MTEPETCPHPPARHFAWYAADDTLVVCCCDCGAVLRGQAEPPPADPTTERLRSFEERAQTAINGFRRWKRNQKRGGNRYEAEHGLDDLGQAIWELDQLLHPNGETP